MSALHSGLPPKPSNGQLPLSWYNAPPWVHVKPSMAPFATKYDTHVRIEISISFWQCMDGWTCVRFRYRAQTISRVGCLRTSFRRQIEMGISSNRI